MDECVDGVLSSSNVLWHGNAKVVSFWKWTRYRLMYCVCLWRWARHQQPAKYLCAAMTQQLASMYILRRADYSTHPFKMSRLGVSYFFQSAHEIWPIRLRSLFIYIFFFKTKFLLISNISFNIRFFKIIIRYQCC